DACESADESQDGRRAREGDGVDRPLREGVGGLGREPPKEDRAIGVDAFGAPALRLERLLQAIGRDVRARTQDAALAARERAGEGRDRECPWLKVGVASRPAAE